VLPDPTVKRKFPRIVLRDATPICTDEAAERDDPDPACRLRVEALHEEPDIDGPDLGRWGSRWGARPLPEGDHFR
jgi:hypothetical protein